MKKKLPYYSGIERKHKRVKLDRALAEYVKRQGALTMSSTREQRHHASLEVVSAKFGMSRTTLGYWKRKRLG